MWSVRGGMGVRGGVDHVECEGEGWSVWSVRGRGGPCGV